MKKTALFIIAIVISFFVLPQSVALADYDYFDLEYSVDPVSVPDGGGLVDLTVKIEHYTNSAYVMADTEVLLGETQIINFRNIYAGQTVTKTGTMLIDSSQVGHDVVLTLKWSDGTTTRSQNFTVKFDASSAAPEVEFTRVIVPQSGDPQTQSKITYTVNNVGTLHISNVEITDPLCGAVDYKELVKSGESFVYTYTRTIGSGYSSQPTLTYKVGEKSYSVELDIVEVKSGEPAIKLEVKTNKDVVAKGEELTIICTVTNTGTADFTNIVITEDTLGDMFEADDLAAGESQVFTTNITIDESTTFNFLAAGDNGTEQEWVAEQSVDITVDESSTPLLVDINASPSSLLLPIAGMIDFDIIINNRGTEPMLNLTIVDQDMNVVEEIASLSVGQSTYQWSVEVKTTTTFTFTLQVPQENGSTRTVNSGPIEIKVAETPDGTDAIDEATPEPILDENDVLGLKKIASSLGFAIGLVVLLVIVLAVLVSRKNRR